MGGITDENDCNNYIGNNHGSIEKIGGRWYVFWHRHTNGTSFSRQACAEEIKIMPDGAIPQVEMTSCGLNGGPLYGIGEYPAAIACNLKSDGGTRRGDIPHGGAHPYITQDGEDGDSSAVQYIANLKEGALCGFKYFNGAGADKISVVIRGTARGYFVVSDGNKDIAKIGLTPSAEWKKFCAPLAAREGIFPLYFTFRGEGYADFLSFELQR